MLAREARIGILAAAFCCLGGLALAADKSISSESATYNLRRPGPTTNELTPITTGPFVEPVSPPLPRHMSIGFNDLGEQLRIHLGPDWALEQRFLMGNSSSDLGTVHANVFGIRGYRFLPEHRRLRLYMGLEGDYVTTSLRSVNTTGNPNSIATISGFGQTSGYALGGFGGVEFRLLKRIALDLDIGPYMIGVKEKVTSVSDASLDFVANTAINVYLF